MEQYFRTRASVDDDPDLARNRRANDARLKSRFEHIFTKYGQDFDGVGDEIDLETGEIVVNNGHVARMRHEVDPGKRVSSQVLRVLGGSAQGNDADGRGSAVEDSLEDWEDDEGLNVSGDSSSDNDNDDENSQVQRIPAHAPDELSSDFYPPDEDDPVTARGEPARGEPMHESHGRTPSRIDKRDNVSTRKRSHEISHNGSPANPLATLPFFQQSMEAMQSNPGQRGSIDADAIQALGRSIADQLARFMTGNSKISRKKSRTKGNARESRWQYPVLPGDQAGRTPSLSPPGSPSAALFAASPDGEASIWAAQPPRRARKGHAGADGELANNEPRICYNCGRTDASTWRRGPNGVRCGGCSSYYHKYGLEKRTGDGSLSHRAESRPRSATIPAHKEPYPTNDETDLYALPATSTPAALAGYSANTARRLLEKGMPAKRQSTETEIGREVLSRGHIPMSTPTDHSDRLLNPAGHVDDGQDSGNDSRRHGKARYTARENQLITGLRENDKMSWDEIANCLPGRSAAALAVHYSSNLRHRQSLANSESARRELLGSENPRTEELERRMEEVPDDGEDYPEESGGHVIQQEDDENEEQLDENFAGPYTPEEDELIITMKDKEDMTFAEMTEYLIGRTEDVLLERYTLLTAHSRHPEHLALHTFARDNLSSPNFAGDARSAPRSRSHHDDARNQMPPPPVPGHLPREGSQSTARMATPMDKRHINSHIPRAGQHNTPMPQTPLVFIPNTGPPPGPSEVSLSAWATTQPASKGPLPFQPARKHLVPVQPNIPPFKLVDPFVSRSDSSVARRQDHSALSDPQRRHGRSKKAPADQSVDDLPWQPVNILPQTPSSASPQTDLHPRRSSRRTRISSLADQEGIYTIPTPDDVDFLQSIATSSQETQEADVATNSVNEVQTHVEPAEGEDSSIGQGPGGTQTINAAFTAKQDKFIKKAREKQQMSWADIAENLPGERTFTAQAVTSRYYDVVMTSTPRSNTHGPTTYSETETKLRQQYSAEESEKVAYYRDEEGMQWKPMSRVMPGRTPKSLQNHYFYHYYVPRQKKLLKQQGQEQEQEHDAAGRPRAEMPLLRQALKNSTRRTSEGVEVSARPGLSSKKSSLASKRTASDANTVKSPQSANKGALQTAAPEIGLDTSRSDRGGSKDEAMNLVNGDNELASRTILQPVTQDEVANAVDVQSEFASPSNIAAGTRQLQRPSPRHVAHVYIEPFRDMLAPPQPSALLQLPLNEPDAFLSAQPEGPGNRAGYEYRSPSPAYAAVYDTPARSHHHSTPHFSAPNPSLATTRVPLDEPYGQLDVDTPVSSPNNDTIVCETSIHEQDANSIILPEAAHSSVPVARSNSVDSVLSTVSKQTGPSGTKRKRSLVSSKRVNEFEVADSDSDSPEAEEAMGDRDDGISPKRPRRTLAQPKRFSSEFHDLTRSKGLKTSEKATDNGDRNAPVRRGVKPGSKRGSYRTKRSSIGSSSGLMPKPVTNDAAQEGEDPARPRRKGPWLFVPDPNEPMQSNSDWADAVSAAIRSTPSQRMAGHAVLDWFRHKYEYYRNSEGPWYHRVRNVLRRNPMFKKVDADAHNSEWTFADVPPTVLVQDGSDGGDEAEGDTSIFDDGEHVFTGQPVHDSTDLNDGGAGVRSERGRALPAEPIQNSTDVDDDYDVEMPNSGGPIADKSHHEEPTATPPMHSSLVHSAPTATEVPEVITISSDAPMKPEPVSEGNTTTTRPAKRSLEVEQPSPRSKALRKSDTALIRRVSALATPARSETRRNSLLARSTIPKRFEPLSARSERGTPAATFIEPTGRRVLWARDVKGDDVGEEDDELA